MREALLAPVAAPALPDAGRSSSSFPEPVTPLLSLPDLAAMKLNAIANRGSKKDFFDLAELLNHLISQGSTVLAFTR